MNICYLVANGRFVAINVLVERLLFSVELIGWPYLPQPNWAYPGGKSRCETAKIRNPQNGPVHIGNSWYWPAQIGNSRNGLVQFKNSRLAHFGNSCFWLAHFRNSRFGWPISGFTDLGLPISGFPHLVRLVSGIPDLVLAHQKNCWKNVIFGHVFHSYESLFGFLLLFNLMTRIFCKKMVKKAPSCVK